MRKWISVIAVSLLLSQAADAQMRWRKVSFPPTKQANSNSQVFLTSSSSPSCQGIRDNLTAGIAQRKAEIQARADRIHHPGGSFGNGTHEGVGYSSTSADQAIQACCYWGQRQPIDIGVSRGARGWYACVIYR
jgi:hypothetical protein